MTMTSPNLLITTKAISELFEIAKSRKELYPVQPHNTYVGIKDAQNLCHQLAVISGWWTNLDTGEPKTTVDVNIAEKLCLIHSEISEAMEGDRKNLMDDKLPHRKMVEVELADALIRIFDLAGFMHLDLAGAMMEKLAFNQKRADHKIENRQQEGGKAY